MRRIVGLRTLAGVAAVVLRAAPAPAQLPGTDIYLAPLYERDGKVVVGAPANVTGRAGYDNQPWFIDDTAFWFSSAVDTSEATDVYRYDIPAASIVRVTDTPESEYSPTLVPGGKGFSCVRVELDGAQRLWRFDLDGANPRVIAAGVDSVGYHAWRDDHTVAVFIVGSPHSLRVVDTDSGAETLVALDIGRALHRVPHSDEISFMQRTGDTWTLARLDADTGAVTPFATALAGSQDCAWTPGGNLLMAREGVVYVLDRERDRWSPVTAFGDPGLAALTRLAVDPAGRWLAVVAAEGE